MPFSLTISLDDSTHAELQRLAVRLGVPAEEIALRAVRTSVADGTRFHASRDVEAKLATLREAAAFSFPSGDIDEILRDIERAR